MDFINNEQNTGSISRRDFLKLGASGTLVLGASTLGGTLIPRFVSEVLADSNQIEYQSSEDLYRNIWQWDKVSWGSHSNVCLPGGCSFRVYVKNGIVWREEQTAKTPASNDNYPDFNPMGCQKGCSFHNNIYGDSRVLYPLKRAGERGEGKWERVTWDQALTEVAISIVEGIEQEGPDGFVLDAPHMHEGSVAWAGAHRMCALLGGLCPDLNVEIGDFYKGAFDTIGKMHTGYSVDNLYDAELVFFSHTNWSYTMPAIYHFITEARYNGTEIVMMAPDYNPSTVCADIHAPVKVGGDAAFWLGVSYVIVSEGLYDVPFVKEQTDLALLVRTDTGRFLRAPDLTGEGREDQLYFYDLTTQSVVPAPRGTLDFEGDQALEGSYQVTLANGEEVTVRPGFESMKERLEDYTPELAAEKSGVPANLIIELGRKVASKVTASYIGFSSAKTYHGDLFERALILAMGLTGNWGKPGTGWNGWAMPAEHIEMLVLLQKPLAQGGLEMLAQMDKQVTEMVLAEDPDATDEIISIAAIQQMTKMLGVVPPVFWLYHHCGFKELYDTADWQDPAMPRSFTEYMEEAIEKGWWTPDQIRPAPDKTPQVLMLIAHNPLRRIRGGAIKYPEVLFPKLKMFFAIETRMSASAMYADIILPAAWYYEKTDLTVSVTTSPAISLIEQAVEPQGEARPEWEIYVELFKKIEQAAAERGLTGYKDIFGAEKRWDQMSDAFTMNGAITNHEEAVAEMTALGAALGTLPPETTYDSLQKDGQVAQYGFGVGFMKHLVANEYERNKPFFSLRWHVDDKKVFPTYTRRAQFYIDHEWYLEVDEHLPVHKDTPKIGGDHPFQITGGHPRHSVHSLQLAEPSLMKLHRGQPVMHLNDRDAMELGLKDGDSARCWNDFSDFEIMVRTSPSVRPKQTIVYFWEVYQFKKWEVYDRLLIGLPKALHFAGGYGQLRYYFYNGSPAPSTDRGVRLSIEKA